MHTAQQALAAVRQPRWTLRTATAHDLPDLHRLAHRAVHRLLGGHHLTARQVRAATAAKIYEVEPELVDAGTYYVAEIDDVVVAGSGWSGGGVLQPGGRNRTGHRVDDATAAMRATYVDPCWARRGLATLLARLTETAATVAGYRRFEALCTPASEALRRTMDYRLVGREQTVLAAGITVTVARMRKELPPHKPDTHRERS